MFPSRLTSLTISLTLPLFLTSSGRAALPSVPVTPTPEPSGVLNLQTALKRGMDYSQELKSAQSQIKGAEDSTAQARGALFPTINGVGSAQNSQNSTTFSSGNI